MKSSFKFLMIFVLFGLISSCGETDKNEQVDYDVELSKTRFTNTYAEYDKFWQYGIEEYGIETLCGCSCDATLSVIDLWNEGGDNIPVHLRGVTINSNASCEDLQGVFKRRCEFDNIIEFKNSIINGLESNNYFTNEEVGLVTILVNSLVTENVDFDDIESRWEVLPTVSNSDNSISQLIIETTRSLKEHHSNNSEIWDQLPEPPGEPKVSKWIWKALGAIGGALSGVAEAGIQDVLVNEINGVPQSQSSLTTTGVIVSAGMGAITGAALAL